ncbi:vesicle-associated membrane protein [Striga asiatica]|uniref:Vesicle-associated membrane protein n=1 Tax=Striga asiatica TaxID=4170 RepID=A0A5A7QHU0_STRAF|nr:vesicle-associated membrane protein [Striga asiatica]
MVRGGALVGLESCEGMGHVLHDLGDWLLTFGAERGSQKWRRQGWSGWSSSSSSLLHTDLSVGGSTPETLPALSSCSMGFYGVQWISTHVPLLSFSGHRVGAEVFRFYRFISMNKEPFENFTGHDSFAGIWMPIRFPIFCFIFCEQRAYYWAAAFLKMTPKGLIYSFVAKGTVVLAEHTPYSGNFSTIAVQCLQKLPSSSSKYTYSCDGHTFNFLLDGGFVFLVVADETMGRSVPFVFLERVKDDFKQHYGDSIKSDGQHPLADDEDEDDDLFEDRFSIAYNLDREFGPKLKEHMQYCMNHPEEMNKLSKLRAQITEVKGIMMDNIEKVHSQCSLLVIGSESCYGLDCQALVTLRPWSNNLWGMFLVVYLELIKL